MKKVMIVLGGFLFAASLGIGSLQAQNSQTPRAYGDKDGDGICDLSGQPVGKGRNQDRSQRGPALNPNCPRNGQGAGQGAGSQTRSGTGQNRGGMGRGAGRG
jgi:hypothetical protein